MADPPTYVLDADVFMTAARSYYAFDLVPRFWDVLVHQASNGRLISIDRVKMDMDRGKDDLTQWANDHFRDWFDSTDGDDVIDAYRQIITWAQGQNQFTVAAKAELAGAADGWLVAYALAKGCVVVTNEKFDSKIQRKIKIPNICRAFGVECEDTFGMLRQLGITF